MSIFGCVVSGRLVQTDFQQVGEAQFVITIPEADNINHVVVFLTGVQPLPVGLAGIEALTLRNRKLQEESIGIMLSITPRRRNRVVGLLECNISVYFSWPNPSAPPHWQMLGHISNEKPSAIFKISNLKKKPVYDESTSPIIFDQQISHVAKLGISVEPMYNVKEQNPVNSLSTVVEMSQKVLQHFLNYITSFAISPAQIEPHSTEMVVPLSKIQNWYSNVERRLIQNPDFWLS